MSLTTICLVLALIINSSCSVNKDASIEGSFKECLFARSGTSWGYCLGYGALSKLQSFESLPEFDLVDGLRFTKDEKMYRDGYNVLESDPADYSGIINSVGQVFSRRNMKWEMDFLYPGLAMTVSPSNGNGGLLEFVMDPLKEATYSPVTSLKEASTARLLTRQFLVPLLLGFKFNIATLIPIIFGIIALIAKKAVILSKIALVISSAFSIGSLLFNGASAGAHQQPYGSHVPTINPSFGGHYSPYRYQGEEPEYNEANYKRSQGNYNEDQFRLLDSDIQQVFNREDKKTGRNFAWSETDKNKKP